jgi:uncharacterized protein
MSGVVVENFLPGVTAIVNSGQVASPINRQPSSTFFAVGYAVWGPPNTALVCTSWNNFVEQFGGFNSNSHLADAAYMFFNLWPGSTAWFVRVVGKSNATWTLTFAGGVTAFTVTVNGHTTSSQTLAGLTAAALQTAIQSLASVGAGNAIVTGATGGPFTVALAGAMAATYEPSSFVTATGTGVTVAQTKAGTPKVGSVTIEDQGEAPQPTLEISAKYPTTEVDISYSIQAGSQPNTFRFFVKSVDLAIAETYDNMVMGDPTSITTVNQKSNLVQITDLGSTNEAPANLPALTALSELPPGDDDFADITDASAIGTDDGNGTRTGLQCFNSEIFGDGQVAIPGFTSLAIMEALDAHANTYHRFAILDPPFGSDAQDLINIRENFGTWYSSIYWPWCLHESFDGSGLQLYYPPSAHAAGACAMADKTIGTQKAPANYVVATCLGVELSANGQSQTDDNTRSLLNQQSINVITPLPEQGVRIYGARVMTIDTRVQMVHEIRLLNLFYYSGKQGYQYAVFAVVDGPNGRLFRDLIASGVAFLQPFWEAGALYGATQDDAFLVVSDASNNPPAALAAQQVTVQWAVAISPTAEQIILLIDNVPLTEALATFVGANTTNP